MWVLWRRIKASVPRKRSGKWEVHVEDKAWSSYLLTTSINQFNNKPCYRPWYLYTISLLGYGALPRTCLPARSVSMQWSVQGLLSPSGKPAWKPQDTSKGGALWGWKKAEWPGTCVFLLVLAWGQSALPSAKLLGLAVCWDTSCSWKWHDCFYGSGVLENGCASRNSWELVYTETEWSNRAFLGHIL